MSRPIYMVNGREVSEDEHRRAWDTYNRMCANRRLLIEESRVEMAAVREYGEHYPVCLERWPSDVRSPFGTHDGVHGPTWCLVGRNEGGHNGVVIDLVDVLRWVMQHRPDLIEAAKLPPKEPKGVAPP